MGQTLNNAFNACLHSWFLNNYLFMKKWISPAGIDIILLNKTERTLRAPKYVYSCCVSNMSEGAICSFTLPPARHPCTIS